MTVEYDNKKWVKQKSGYYQCTQRKFKGKNWLHQYVYEKEKYIIPKGLEVHHLNENKDDNSIDNLVLLTPEDHRKLHGDYKITNPERYKKQCEHLDKVRPDHVWPEDPIKYEKHRQALIDGMAKTKLIVKVCENCGDNYEVMPFGSSRFCSNKCKSAKRRESGVDNIIEICSICGISFIKNKYSKSMTCSRSCGNVQRARTMKNAVS